MIHSKNIRETLLRNLFINPNPINKKEYLKAKNQIFPGCNAFISFLKLDEHQLIVQKAKEILQRLAFQLDFPPASKLIHNLHVFEEEEKYKNSDKQGYVPQDHVVHLINLYLLGIYIFSYHKKLHRRTVEEISVIKRSLWKNLNSDEIERLIDFNEYKQFSTMWAYFVLYHDLGYPIERILPNDRIDKEGYLSPYKNIIKSTYKDITLKILSKLIILDSVINTEVNETINDIYFQNLSKISVEQEDKLYSYKVSNSNDKYILDYIEKQGKSNDNILEKKLQSFIHDIKNSELLRDVHNTENLFEITSFLSKQNIFAVLEDEQTGIPQLVVAKNYPDFDVVWLNGDEYISNFLYKKRNQLRNIAFCKNPVFSKKYIWRYFIKNIKGEFQNFVESLIEENERENYNEIKNHVQNTEEYFEAELLSDDGLEELKFIAYKELNNLHGYQFEEFENDNSAEAAFKKLYNKNTATINLLPDLVAKSVKKIIKKEINDNKDFNPLSILNEKGKDEASKDYIKHILSFQNEIQIALAEELKKNVTKNFNIEFILKNFSKFLRSKISDSFGNELEPLISFFEQMKFDQDFTLDNINKDQEFSVFWDGILKKNGLEDWDSIVKNYKPEWTKKEFKEKFIDHGMFAAVLLVCSFAIYNGILKNCIEEKDFDKHNENQRLLRFYTSNLKYIKHKWMLLQNDYLKSIVGSSVLIHNLYPSHFRKSEFKRYKTKASNNPFAFIAILSDTIQRWDREKLSNIAKTDVNDVIPGTKFDLQIQDDLLYITLISPQINMNETEKALRTSLRDFLFNGDKIIKLQLLERV